MLALGSDSNARISMLEEMRWLEYGQRLRHRRRGALRDGDGQVARALLAAATTGGARALGVPAGAIAAGAWADLVVLDLNAPALGGVDPEHLLDALVFGGSEEAILATCVAGEWQDHRPPAS
jgi:formimidoylglutamate deiminase